MSKSVISFYFQLKSFFINFNQNTCIVISAIGNVSPLILGPPGFLRPQVIAPVAQAAQQQQQQQSSSLSNLIRPGFGGISSYKT
jgi:hypothetical protein